MVVMSVSKKLEFNNNIRKVVHKSSVSITEHGIADVTDDIMDAVRCEVCQALHLKDSDDRRVRFITIVGNIHANDSGGLVGNGDWDKHGVPVTHYCPGCLIKVIKGWAVDPSIKGEDPCR
jgi:hypothetical protein